VVLGGISPTLHVSFGGYDTGWYGGPVTLFVAAYAGHGIPRVFAVAGRWLGTSIFRRPDRRDRHRGRRLVSRPPAPDAGTVAVPARRRSRSWSVRLRLPTGRAAGCRSPRSAASS
jgi:hypothetical protein